MSTKILGQDIQTQKYTTGGGTTAYTATVPNLTALYDGFAITVKMNATNTGSSTLNVNGLGAKTIKKPWVTDLSASDLLINSCYQLVYDLAQDFFFLLRVVSSTLPTWWALGVWTKVWLMSFWTQNEDSDLEWYYYLFEATNHIFIVWIFNTAGGVSSWNSKAWIMVINKNTWEIKIKDDYFNGVNGWDWWAANRISYDDSTWDFYYTYENPVPTVVRKFTYSTAVWSSVWALSGTTTSMTWNFFVNSWFVGTWWSLTYWGKTYTIYLQAFDVDSLDQSWLIYVTVT